jgi:hypothetical protein
MRSHVLFRYFHFLSQIYAAHIVPNLLAYRRVGRWQSPIREKSLPVDCTYAAAAAAVSAGTVGKPGTPGDAGAGLPIYRSSLALLRLYFHAVAGGATRERTWGILL